MSVNRNRTRPASSGVADSSPGKRTTGDAPTCNSHSSNGNSNNTARARPDLGTGLFSRTASRRYSVQSAGGGATPGTPLGSVASASPYSKGRVVRRMTTQATALPAAGRPSLTGRRATNQSSSALETAMPGVKSRRCFVVAIMAHCGSIYEELARQLVATGRWTCLTLKIRAGVKTLYVASTQQDISEVNIHLLLGDKPSSERVISARRALHLRVNHGPPRSGFLFRPAARVPMGYGDDGEPRVVDFIENTRCITLKSTMLTTLLRYHRHDWAELGAYLPMTVKILPHRPAEDERRRHFDIARTSLPEGAPPPLWIAKSSSGCHGDDIEIFPGDRNGVQRMLTYIENHPRVYPWVAQQYIDRPLLYHKRKFDIRIMVLFLRDTDEVFVHEDLVMRMSSVVYNRESATGKSKEARLAHITNHCIQETHPMYSAFEEGNELWREHLDGLIRYKADRLPAARRRELVKGSGALTPRVSGGGGGALNQSGLSTSRSVTSGNSPYPIDLNASSTSAKGGSSSSPARAGSVTATATATPAAGAGITLQNAIMPQIYRIVVDTTLASRPFLPVEPWPMPTHCFQVFGYDFLIDEALKVWLLEINGAPGGPTRLVPKIMADTIELAINPYFPCTLEAAPKLTNGYTRVYPE